MTKIVLFFIFFCTITVGSTQKFAIDFEAGQAHSESWKYIYLDEEYGVNTAHKWYWNFGMGASYELSPKFYIRTSFEFLDSNDKCNFLKGTL